MVHMNRKRLIPWLANFFIPLAGMSTDIYLPSLPAIQQHFMTTPQFVQLTVTAFALSMGLMQFIAGPLSDAFGRKKLFLVAIFMQISGVFAVLLSPTIEWMVVSRFFQGIGAAFLIVPARAILNDTFDGLALKKQFNYITISFAMGPVIAPFLGGYIQRDFGWRANFVFILGYALIALMLILFVYRETIKVRHTFQIRLFWDNYKTIAERRIFLVSSLFAACMIAPSALFNVAGPFIIQVAMQRSPVFFGHMALLIGLSWFLGNVTNRLLIHVSPHLKITVGLVLVVIASSVMWSLSKSDIFTPLSFLLPLCVAVFVSGGLFSIMVADCLMMFKALAASANAFLFGIVWIGFSLFSVLAGFLKGASLAPMAVTLLVLNLVCWTLFAAVLWLERHCLQ